LVEKGGTWSVGVQDWGLQRGWKQRKREEQRVKRGSKNREWVDGVSVVEEVEVKER
jgi:hypothetical protein